MKATILIVDDDESVGDLLEEILRGEDYSVRRAYSGTEALLAVNAERPDLILLDLMLPGLSGEEVLPRLGNIPVIVLSAKTAPDTKAELLLGGAADYVTKPFDTRELLARITVALRRNEAASPVLRSGCLRMDLTSRAVTADGVEVRLTRTEFAILKILMQNGSRVVAKSVLLDRIAADTPDCTESSLKIHVSNLRRKLREACGKDCVEAVWGIGYKMFTES
ncbi:MAG: response regulator transcription factor [Clostridia bacterium]|nr:response regulator transcription factor [Clostridia bacterium]